MKKQEEIFWVSIERHPKCPDHLWNDHDKVKEALKTMWYVMAWHETDIPDFVDRICYNRIEYNNSSINVPIVFQNEYKRIRDKFKKHTKLWLERDGLYCFLKPSPKE